MFFSGCVERSRNTLEMGDNFFDPKSLAVERGTTVTWINKGEKNHTATGSDFDSDLIAPGWAFTHTFEEDGTYEVVCTFHEFMIGEVKVGTGIPRIPSSVEAGSRAE